MLEGSKILISIPYSCQFFKTKTMGTGRIVKSHKSYTFCHLCAYECQLISFSFKFRIWESGVSSLELGKTDGSACMRGKWATCVLRTFEENCQSMKTALRADNRNPFLHPISIGCIAFGSAPHQCNHCTAWNKTSDHRLDQAVIEES